MINETLEVYRFIVERYAAYNSPEALAGDQSFNASQILSQLAIFLDDIWKKNAAESTGDLGEDMTDGQEKTQRERSLVLSSIMRIMSHILAKMPFHDVDPASASSILALARRQAPQAVVLAADDYVLNEFALTYLGCLARVQLSLLPVVEQRLDPAYTKDELVPAVCQLIEGEVFEDPKCSIVVQDLCMLTLVGQVDPSPFLSDMLQFLDIKLEYVTMESEESVRAGELLTILAFLCKQDEHFDLVHQTFIKFLRTKI